MKNGRPLPRKLKPGPTKHVLSQTPETTIPQSAPSAYRTSSLWQILFDGRKWSKEASEKRIEIASILASVLIVGLLIPLLINMHSNNREGRERCFNSIIEIRRAKNTMNDGFIVAPRVPIARGADARNVLLTIENAEFACSTTISDNTLGHLSALKSRTEELLTEIAEGKFENHQTFQQTNFTKDLGKWTDEVMQNIVDDNFSNDST